MPASHLTVRLSQRPGCPLDCPQPGVWTLWGPILSSLPMSLLPPPECTFCSSRLAFFTRLPLSNSLLAGVPRPHLPYCSLTFPLKPEWDCVLCPPALVPHPRPRVALT